MKATANPALLERRPHVATRAVVESLGDEVPRALYRAFDAFNAEHFDDALGAPLLFLTQTSSPRALGDYCGRDVHGLRSRIRIAPRTLARGEAFAADVVLHEMVHAWQSEVGGDLEEGYKGHGPRFAWKCNEIGAKLGLPAVGVKGRHGLPDCAQWPMCVRPDGYYPEPAPRRSARSRRGGGGPAGGDVVDGLRTALIEAVAIVEDLDEEQRRELGFEAWLEAARDALG